MSRFIGTAISLIGIVLLGSGLLLPHGLGGAVWQSGLGLLLLTLGFAMVLTANPQAGRGLAGLVGLLGLALLVATLAPRLIGFGFYSTFGTILRGVLGLLFCLLSYALFEFGSEIVADKDDFF